MRERLRVFFYLIIFWLAFMVIARAWFLAYNHDLSAALSWNEILLSMLHGLRMDGSMSGYFLAASGLLLTFSVLFRGRWIFYTLTTLTLVLLFLSCVIVMVDFELYRHWGFRMNTTPLFYMGSEAMGSIEVSVVIKLILALVILFSAFAIAYFRWIAPRVRNFPAAKPQSALPLLLASALMFLPIRGSFSVAPMNTGFVYFHPSKAYANHAAINVVWNFLYSIRKSANLEYSENFFDKAKTEKYFASLYPQSSSTTSLLKTKRPNIIFIILESFTADVIEPLGGIKDIAPNLNKLCHEGILFDHFYSSGDRTDKGLISILSGYPAQPATSIIKSPAKTQRLPYLSQFMKELGYRTSFVYGGDIDFANFRSYLTTGGFDNITTMDDFPDELNESKWGVHDHFMLDQAMSELDTTTGTFFKVILTLSSHEPFDVPMEPYIKGNDPEALFLNSCYYTDKSIGDFITRCKQKPWWDNTLVIFTADHGHRHPGNKELKDKERFKVPLLMIGGAISKDTVIHTLGGQTDIANTLLAQLDRPHPEFTFSKDLLGNKVVPFAAYFFNDGYGFLMPDKYIIYDNTGRQFLRRDNATEEDLEISKAYQQTLYSDYNRR
jgi:phosphoglycerol transferase MdoB-like AlkP superfamily enzyme